MTPERQDEKQKERLKWACRRGMLELDLFLVPFLENVYEELSSEEKSLFKALLKEDDPSLLAWLMAEKRVELSHFDNIIKKIRQYRLSRITGTIL